MLYGQLVLAAALCGFAATFLALFCALAARFWDLDCAVAGLAVVVVARAGAATTANAAAEAIRKRFMRNYSNSGLGW